MKIITDYELFDGHRTSALYIEPDDFKRPFLDDVVHGQNINLVIMPKGYIIPKIALISILSSQKDGRLNVLEYEEKSIIPNDLFKDEETSEEFYTREGGRLCENCLYWNNHICDNSGLHIPSSTCLCGWHKYKEE